MTATTSNGRITPADIENRIRGLLPDEEDRIGPVPKQALPVAAVAGALVLAAALGMAFLMGRKKGRRKSTFVEITRL